MNHDANNPDCYCESCLERASREDRLNREALAAASALTDYVNDSSSDSSYDRFAKAMHRQHRTLQQHFTRLCIAWFEHLASLNRDQYDLRNKAAVEFAKKLVKTKTWQTKYLPYI